ncbi:conserved exported hypothetical protein [uncultured Desulfobacterium sp.]|uniref:Uncharacterized protein n=1 Tax=uncultured Desulfobacterium sp. TaxID=201089 RepID=A0A445N011_9BACT|nr:conserved exported hypothetical protein [uncultured Desulfobacterium sp.]
MRKTVVIAAIVGFIFAAHTRLYASESTVDIDALKEQIKKELRAERPWQDEIASWKIDIHGFASQGFLCSDKYNFLAPNSDGGSFSYNEIGINFGKDLTDKLRIGVQFLARDLGDIYNDEPEIDWAYGDYHWQDWLGIRAGILKVPLGLYNETRDVDMLRTSVLLPGGVYHEPYREFMMGLIGVGVYGAIPLGPIGGMDYTVEAGTINLADDGGIAKQYEDDVRQIGMGPFMLSDFEISDFDFEEMYVGSLVWRSPWGLRLGGTFNRASFTTNGRDENYLAGGVSSGYACNVEMDTTEIRNYTLSAEYTWEDLVLAAEYWNNTFWTKSTFDFTVAPPPVPIVSVQQSTKRMIEGYYFSASYRFTQWFELGSYYSVYYPFGSQSQAEGLNNPTIPGNKDYTKDWTLSTRFDFNEYWAFKVEGHRMNGTAYPLFRENDSFPDKRWWLLAAKITFSF